MSPKETFFPVKSHRWKVVPLVPTLCMERKKASSKVVFLPCSIIWGSIFYEPTFNGDARR